ncbi:hypothetical protein PRVXT_001257 [Proteinivorax tanatarense]|uniref:Nicotianamine synthase protein n=1 Tax=Proteinivorax tanatarense TaxID=1260629 RepID=A0AAU7VQE2_9FIRM
MWISRFTQWCECKMCSIKPVRELYSYAYKKVVMEEIDLAELNKADNVLFIGGGAIPYSAMYISEYCSKVTVLDCDKCCATKAQQLIKSLDLKNIDVKYINGKHFDFSSYSIIFVPLQAEPKGEILKSIAETAPKDAKILIRSPKPSSKCYTTLDNAPIKLKKFRSLNQLTFDKTFLCSVKDITL